MGKSFRDLGFSIIPQRVPPPRIWLRISRGLTPVRSACWVHPLGLSRTQHDPKHVVHIGSSWGLSFLAGTWFSLGQATPFQLHYGDDKGLDFEDSVGVIGIWEKEQAHITPIIRFSCMLCRAAPYLVLELLLWGGVAWQGGPAPKNTHDVTQPSRNQLRELPDVLTLAELHTLTCSGNPLITRPRHFSH